MLDIYKASRLILIVRIAYRLDVQSYLKAFVFTAAVSTRNTFFLNRATEECKKNQNVRDSLGSYPIISPRRDSRFLFSAFIPRIASTKGDIPVYSVETPPW